jgi:hypothetical protein
MFPSYNEITAFLLVVVALALYRGLVMKHWAWLAAAGLFGGLSVFVRLPNLAVAGLAVAIFFYRILDVRMPGNSLSVVVITALREVTIFVLGYLSGMGLVLALMVASGQFSTYVTMLRQLFMMFGDASQHHGGGRLLRGLIHDYFYSGVAALIFLLAGSAIAWGAGQSQSRVLRVSLGLAASVALTSLLLIFEDAAMYIWPGIIYSILLAGALGLLNLSRDLRLLCVLAGLVLFVTPLGSNNGIFNAVYAMYLAGPVAVLALLRPTSEADSVVAEAEENTPDGALKSGSADGTNAGRSLWLHFLEGRFASSRHFKPATVGAAMLAAMIVFALVHRWNFTYRDSSDRLAMRAMVHHEKLRGIFTTSTRAQSLEELLGALQPLVHNGDYLMDHMQLPMIYFLTEARPYLYSTWPNLYEPPMFRRAMEQAFAERVSLPVCVWTKVDTCHPAWPDGTYPPFQTYRFAENRRLVETFLHQHHYQKQWENSAFEIWLPPGRQSHA